MSVFLLCCVVFVESQSYFRIPWTIFHLEENIQSQTSIECGLFIARVQFNPLILFKMQLSPPQNVFNNSLYFFFPIYRSMGQKLNMSLKKLHWRG